ncbi:UDP-glycosyltransferase 73C4-like [Nymphaea colorata]|nr:UDP-glycosyltransferase 73C4-like [Nymphaea colorata]
MGSGGREMMLIPAQGQGHLFPCAQLSLQLASRGISVTVVLPSDLAPSIAAACHDQPLVRVCPISLPPHPTDTPHHQIVRLRNSLIAERFTEILSQLTTSDGPPPPVCVIFDALAGWATEICERFAIPTVAFFTNGTCACALEYVGYHLPLEGLNPDDPVSIPGLPETLRLTYADLSNKPPPSAWASDRRFPPWVADVKSATAFLFNTCDELERPFIDCISREAGKKAFGVGPLLPRQLWDSAGAPLRDGAVRSKRDCSISEDEVEAWLDSKPVGSVVFVSFGSELSPSSAELAELAAALEESGRPFIWVIQAEVKMFTAGVGAESAKDPWLGMLPQGFEEKVKERGLVVRGWAPQLLILSHPSTGGFVSHCGWNSSLESLACGVPILAWPIRGDQWQNAILVAEHLRVGAVLAVRGKGAVNKKQVVDGLEKVMGDGETRSRAADLKKTIFSSGFPASSSTSIDAFIDLFQTE